MEIGNLISKEILVEIDGAKLTFQPSSHQDLIFAMNLLDYLQGDNLKQTAIDKDTCIKHVFSKLKSAEGVKSAGVELTAEQLKEIAPRAQSKAIIPIVSSWAINVAKDHGLIGGEEAKND